MRGRSAPEWDSLIQNMANAPDNIVSLCQPGRMQQAARLDRGLHRRLVDSLYLEAMVMADEARAYFDTGSLGEDMIDPLRRVAFACESLKVTTRLMHVIAWLLSQRAWQRGEISDGDLREDKYRLGSANWSETAAVADFPFTARSLISGSQDLYDRVARLQQRIDQMTKPLPPTEASPARALLDRLHSAF